MLYRTEQDNKACINGRNECKEHNKNLKPGLGYKKRCDAEYFDDHFTSLDWTNAGKDNAEPGDDGTTQYPCNTLMPMSKECTITPETKRKAQCPS